MNAFIKKNKKAVIWGVVALAAIGVWYWKFRKPASPVIAPAIAPKAAPGTTMPAGVVAGQPAPVNKQPVVVSAATVRNNQAQAQELATSYNRLTAAIPKGQPPNATERAALSSMAAQISALGYKVVSGNLVTA